MTDAGSKPKRIRPIILRIPAEKFDALLIAGAKLSNICFNLSQRAAIPETDRKVMKESQVEWDTAKSKL